MSMIDLNEPPTKQRRVSSRPLRSDVIDLTEESSSILLPAVLLQEILSFNTPFELSVCACVSSFYRTQCTQTWRLLPTLTISPSHLPCLLDDYDSQLPPRRFPLRSHAMLNSITHKLAICTRLRELTLERTMFNAGALAKLLANCPNLTNLTLNENPWIFLETSHSHLPTAPSLQSLTVCSMYSHTHTALSFRHLLQSSPSLQTLKFIVRDPFICCYCSRRSLCKYHKCEDCQLRSYCSLECQRRDWLLHQWVCPTLHLHDHAHGHHELPLINSRFLDTLCSAAHLNTIDFTSSCSMGAAECDRLSRHCRTLKVLKLNGCNVDDRGLSALATNLATIRILELRASVCLTDASIGMLAQEHWRSLEEIDVSRCCLVGRKAILAMVQRCKSIQVLSIACGIKRGGWIWGVDDELAQCIVDMLRGLRRIEYLCADDDSLSRNVERKLLGLQGLEALRISTDQRSEIVPVAAGAGVGIASRLRVHVVRASVNENPVLMQCIKQGRVTHTQRFRR